MRNDIVVRRHIERAAYSVAIVVIGLGFNNAADAYTYDFGDDTSLDANLTTTYTVGIRTEKPSDKVVHAPLDPATGLSKTANYDDPDQNFHQGDLITNAGSAFLETNFRRGDFGFKASGSFYYDQVYHENNSNSSPGTVNKYGDNSEFTSGTRYVDGGPRFKAYDLFAYGAFSPFGTDLSVRLGNQVVAWGESLFFGNISLSQGPVDTTKSNFPGAEVKDILLPVPQISFNWGVADKLSLLGYYQFDYQPNLLDGVGSYFSRADVVGPGASFAYGAVDPFTGVPGGSLIGSLLGLPPQFNVAKGDDIRPSNQGQFGLGATYALNDITTTGVYFLNYHDKNPLPYFDVESLLVSPGGLVTFPIPEDVPTTYHQKYFSDIRLYGASLSTILFGVNVGADFAYRQGAPTLVGTMVSGQTLPQPTRSDDMQLNLNGLYIIPATSMWDSLTLVGEVSYNRLTKIDAFDFKGAKYSELYRRDKESAGVQLQATLGYTDVFPGGWDMAVPINVGSAFYGSPAYNGELGALTGHGDSRVGVGVTFTRLSNLQLSATYSTFLGHYDPILRPLVDRDFALVSAKYTF